MNLSKREQDKLLADNFRQISRFATVFWQANRHLELDDCIGEAMLTMSKYIHRFDPDRGVAFTTWAWRLIKRRLSNYRRDQGVSRGSAECDTDAVESSLDEGDSVESRIDETRLRERIDERAPLLSRYLMGHTFTDIAAAEAVDKSTVSRRAAKETTAIRELMGQGATAVAAK